MKTIKFDKDLANRLIKSHIVHKDDFGGAIVDSHFHKEILQYLPKYIQYRTTQIDLMHLTEPTHVHEDEFFCSASQFNSAYVIILKLKTNSDYWSNCVEFFAGKSRNRLKVTELEELEGMQFNPLFWHSLVYGGEVTLLTVFYNTGNEQKKQFDATFY